MNVITRAQRLARLRRLRELNAPRWIIRSEQVALALVRRGLKHTGIGARPSKAQSELYAKYVTPLMGKDDDYSTQD